MNHLVGPVIFIVPGMQARAWIEALKVAAARRGLTYMEDWGAGTDVQYPTVGVTVVWTEILPSTGVTVVIAPDEEDAIRGCASFYNVDTDEGMRIASRRYSLASVLVEGGAQLCRPGGSVTIPGLGEVEIGASALAPSQSRPLEIFDQLPVPVGASAEWPAELMWAAGEPVCALSDQYIDLTGRRRLLAFGPFIMLPPGRWRVQAILEVKIESSPVVLNMEWGVEGGASEDFTVSESGIYRVVLEQAWKSSTVPQFKLILQQAAFSGYLKLKYMRCELYGKECFHALDSSNPILRGS